MALSQPQTDLYWRQWGRVTRTNHWHADCTALTLPGSRARGRCPRFRGADHSQWHRGVFGCAELLARQAGRAISADDLRKGCHVYAFGSVTSSKHLDNEQFDRLLNVFSLLIDSDNLVAVAERNDYEAYDRAAARISECRRLGIDADVVLPDHPGERRRHLAFLGKIPEGVVASICRDKFGSTSWRTLPLASLRHLTMTLKNRRAYEHRPMRPAEPELVMASDNEPF
jgi:hypothetical protein